MGEKINTMSVLAMQRCNVGKKCKKKEEETIRDAALYDV